MRARRLGRWFARLAVVSAFGAAALAGATGTASAADADPEPVSETVTIADRFESVATRPAADTVTVLRHDYDWS